MKQAIAIIVIAASGMAFANPYAGNKMEHKAKMDAHKAEINQACSADAATAGCSGKEVGTGLMKCLHAYKKANKSFELSEGCKSATQAAKNERKEMKAKKAELQEEKANK